MLKKIKQTTLDLKIESIDFPLKLHQILHGDVYAALSSLIDNSIDCAITSPPYWAQRDYGFDNQIGNETSLEEYCAKLTIVYHELREKLKPQGIFYHNIGDKYLNKYGNTSLGMIPYKLAYFMVQDGWILEDIIIWYKPNHMPSSVKNRFTNTYEPVFVFAKSSENYYKILKKGNPISNILKIPLQMTSYAHMATYPEKLVEAAFQLGIPKQSTILDPFGGSGTTCKAVQNFNKKLHYQMQSILIEAQLEFVKIIKERCHIQNDAIKNIPNIDYPKEMANFKQENIEYRLKENTKFNFTTEALIIQICNSNEEYKTYLPMLFDESFFDNFPDEGVIFFGLPDHEIKKIIEITQASRWIIRNMLVIPVLNDWIPIFMLVKDVKSIEYKFNIDSIRVDHRFENKEDWHDTDFIGYKVVQSQLFYTKPQTGIIIKILSLKSNGFPNWVGVKWDSGEITVEEGINFPILDRLVEFHCPKCDEILLKYHHNQKETLCPKCNLLLWQDVESIPKLFLNNRTPPTITYKKDEGKICAKNTKKDYVGKFKDAERINMGQSPGARASVSEQYFSVQKYYSPNQALICDYLNLYRKKIGFSKNDLIRKFPPEYKHTVGHWLRKDMGGSIPKQEDMLQLQKILEFDDIYLLYTTRMGIKLQTVLANECGKNPGDLLEFSLPEVIKMLEKVSEF